MYVSNSRSQIRRWRMLAVVLSVVALPAWASAQTTSDLFEKAVYADETVGDLDEAIELYGQVIAKSKAAGSIAAEAQYRLGLCFEKQGEQQKARDAFQAVVDDYPQSTQFVSLAKKRLPGALELLPVPWKDGQKLHMDFALPTGKKIGKFVYGVEATEHNGRSVWRCYNRAFINLNDMIGFSEVFCDKQSFAPLKSHAKNSILGQADATYASGKVTIDLLGREDPLELDFTVPSYDNEQAAQMFRRLPLEVGFHTELSVIVTLTGEVVSLKLDVPKKETITTAAGKFDCYRLELNIGQTFWISDDANRYLVRFAMGGIVADLTRVEQRRQDESIELADDMFSISLPVGWDTYEEESKKDGRNVYLLDRRGIAFAKLSTVAKEKLTEGGRKAGVFGEDEQASPQVWIEAALKKRADGLKNFKVRGAGVGKLELEDHEAVSAIFDFEQEEKPMTGYFVVVFGDRMAGFLKFVLPADQFESQRGEYDQLVRSLRMK